MDSELESPAYWEGMSAYNDSLDEPGNPYQEGTVPYKSWDAGYQQGKMDW